MIPPDDKRRQVSRNRCRLGLARWRAYAPLKTSHWKARFSAGGAHLAASAAVAGLAAALVLLLWYPAPYADVSGGIGLLSILVAVDVVVGPLLTLAVFDLRKPRAELRRDIAVIVALQLAALAYGLFTVAQARPAVVALEVDRLRVVRAIDLTKEELAKAPEDLRSLQWTGPAFVATRAVTASEQWEAIDRALAGQDIGMRPDFWLASSRTAAAYAQAAKPVNVLATRYRERVALLDAAIAGTGLPAERLGFLPILGRSTDWSALVDRESGRVMGYVQLEGF